MLAIFNDGEGEADIQIRVFTPDQEAINPLPNEGRGRIRFTRGENTVVSVEWVGFKVPKWGAYEFQVLLDGRPYTHKFTIKEATSERVLGVKNAAV